MRSRFGRNPVPRALFSAALLFFGATAQGRGVAHEWNGVKRVVAVGDVHGAYENFVEVLEGAGLIDARLQWIGGRAHLVQTGDVLDRGPDSRKVMDLLMELEVQAEKAGGRVHALIGNHEAMNVAGFLDYVSPREFHSYTDPRSLERREQAFRRNFRRLMEEASERGRTPPRKRMRAGSSSREFRSGTWNTESRFLRGGGTGGGFCPTTSPSVSTASSSPTAIGARPPRRWASPR